MLTLATLSKLTWRCPCAALCTPKRSHTLKQLLSLIYWMWAPVSNGSYIQYFKWLYWTLPIGFCTIWAVLLWSVLFFPPKSNTSWHGSSWVGIKPVIHSRVSCPLLALPRLTSSNIFSSENASATGYLLVCATCGEGNSVWCPDLIFQTAWSLSIKNGLC